MRLTYRAVNYEYDIPTIETTEGPVTGKYRGQDTHTNYPRHIPTPVYNELKYRGVAYTVGEPKVCAIKEAPQETKVATEVGRGKVSNLADVHYQNLCQRLEYRKQAAMARGDHKLLQLLEKESRQMVC